jgi:hypothetical protein
VSMGARAMGWGAALTLVLSLSACGGGTAQDRLDAVAENVDRIESGVLDMRLSLSAASAPDEPIGFMISGPFGVGAEGLVADLTYRQIAGSEEAEMRFVAVDGRAFVEAEGTFYELPVEDDSSPAEAATMLQDLGFADWAVNPTVREGGHDDHLTVVSRLDEVSAMQGIGLLLDDLEMKEASGLALLDGLDDEAVERTVEHGTMTVRIGPDDLLRRLIVRMRFGIDHASPLAETLRDVAGAELLFSVEIAETDQPVSVAQPVGARPISDLPAA